MPFKLLSLSVLCPILLVGSVLTSDLAAAEVGSCKHYSAERQVFWGDLHVHTALSMDAYSFGTRMRPEDAYRFARGEKIQLLPLPLDVQLERPLDFAAITDHASDAGATRLCTTPGSSSYATAKCAGYRAPVKFDKNDGIKDSIKKMVKKSGGLEPGSFSTEDICGIGGQWCLDAEKAIWTETQAAADKFNDSSDECDFTTFVAYEYTATPALTKIHRNVIFKNEKVIDLPISAIEEPDETVLWQRLKDECIGAGTGCDVLAIPHNPNLSNGNLFTLQYASDSSDENQVEMASLRALMEPVMEIMQMKGDSECRNNMWNILGGSDELCEWEKMRSGATPDCKNSTSEGALMFEGCVSRLDYARYALVEGLKEKERIGINPYQFGFIGSTDTHNGTPGATEEWRSDIPDSAPSPQAGRNPGGMAAVWAEENSREAIFDALRRREVYATSGPRMSVRLFGGDNIDPGICESHDLVKTAYRQGVPMGGVLETGDIKTGALSFVVTAQQDAGTIEHPGNLLQRAQIIKGWSDPMGNIHQQVVDIAGGENKAVVDIETCEPSGPGHKQFCAQWTDPDFDPKQNAVYYARIIENPSCRTTGWTCSAANENKKPAWCGSGLVELTTRERAWTSPIWVNADN
jgi:hypothetical protein